MEFAKTEVEMIKAVVDAVQADVQELNDLQMALIGGGAGDPVAY
jgi:hypothetical protein